MAGGRRFQAHFRDHAAPGAALGHSASAGSRYIHVAPYLCALLRFSCRRFVPPCSFVIHVVVSGGTAGAPGQLRVDTVERMQGAEAEVAIICYGFLDRDRVARETDFLFDRNRLNVSMTRARKLCILVRLHKWKPNNKSKNKMNGEERMTKENDETASTEKTAQF